MISNCAEILLNKQYVISSSTPNFCRVQDFIAQLLMRNARHRLSAAQCMEHPWLMEQDIGTEVGDTEAAVPKYLCYYTPGDLTSQAQAVPGQAQVAEVSTH